MTSLLTRKVRLPIPSMAQLDAARSFGSAFEQQRVGDMFRVRSLGHVIWTSAVTPLGQRHMHFFQDQVS